MNAMQCLQTKTSKTINPRRLDGLVGQPVDLTEWAYAYRQGAADNPPEAQWLWPSKYMQWHQKWRGPWAFYYAVGWLDSWRMASHRLARVNRGTKEA